MKLPQSAGSSRKRQRRKIVAAAIFATALTLAPVGAWAADYNYQTGSLVMNTWKWSGHHTMNGAKAWGYNFAQILYLQNDGFGLQSGYDYIFVTHSRTFTVSKCTWYHGGVPAGTSALTSCAYTN